MANFSTLIQHNHRVLSVTGQEETLLSQEQWYIPNRAWSVFSPPLWSTIGIIIVLLVVTHLTMTPTTHDNGDGKNNDSNSLHMPSFWRWFAHYIQGNHYIDFEHSSTGLKLILLITGLFTIHTLCLYQGYLLTQLVSDPPNTLPFSSIEDVAMLIERKVAVVNLVSPYYRAAQILANPDESSYESMRELGRALRNNPPIFAATNDPILSQLHDEGIQVVTFWNNFEV